MQPLISTVILFPLAAAWLSWAAPTRSARKLLALPAGLVLMGLSGLIYAAGPVSFSPHPLWGRLLHVADYGLLAGILIIAVRLQSRLSWLLLLVQLGLLIGFDVGLEPPPPDGPKIVVDALGLTLCLVVNGIGGLVLVYSPAYIAAHEERIGRRNGPEKTFLFFMILFLGAMNGLIFANDGRWLFFFWELTTLCSFALIAHDRTKASLEAALRALWMTLLGGVFFLAGLILLYLETGGIALDRILSAPPSGMYLAGAALLCAAGLTKAAIPPFHKWLLGAMVAPAPVSALLHASTMVKAGAFLILRLMPAYAGTFLGWGIAWIGAFGFMAMGAAAIHQADTKRILACSTILNLGLIIACAGFGTAMAAAAAVLLLVFHALAKALLFLCVGAVEVKTGKRTLDDLKGLGARMPLTTGLMLIGILSLLLPPFGVVTGKWLLLKAAAADPLPLFFVILGMAFHLLLYVRWGGDLLSRPHGDRNWSLEPQPLSIRLSMLALTAGLAALSPLVPLLFSDFVVPVIRSVGLSPEGIAGWGPAGGYGLTYLPALAGALGAAVLAAAWISLRLPPEGGARPAYVGGADAVVEGEAGYKGPFNRFEPHQVTPYYFSAVFRSGLFNRLITAASAAILLMVLAGAVWIGDGGLPWMG